MTHPEEASGLRVLSDRESPTRSAKASQAVPLPGPSLTLFVFTPGSLEMTPVPLQGASSRTRSKPPTTWGKGGVTDAAASSTAKFLRTDGSTQQCHQDQGTRRSLRRTGAHLGELASVIVADDGVGDSQPVQVAHDALEALGIGVIGKDHTRVLHQLSCGRERGVQGLAALLPHTQNPQANSIPPGPTPLRPASQPQVHPSIFLAPPLLTIFLALPSLWRTKSEGSQGQARG